MEIWIRVHIELTESVEKMSKDGLHIKPQLAVTIYPNENAAKLAAEKCGGLAFFTDTTKLKHIYEPENINFEEGEGKNTRLWKERLIDGLLSDDEEVGPMQDDTLLVVSYSSLPHTLEESPTGGEEDAETQTLPVFSGEADVWLKSVEAEMGAHLTL